MNSVLDEVVRRLAALLGVAPEDLDSAHGRWQLYDRAINDSVGLELLLQAVELEDDRALAVSIVLRMLELVPDNQHSMWINQLSPDNRSYSKRRANEISLLRRSQSGRLNVQEAVGSLDSWSDWLQLRLATSLADPQTLEVISTQGRTRRIRIAATERRRRLLSSS